MANPPVPGSSPRTDPLALGWRIQAFPARAGRFGAGVGSAVLLGWLLDLPALKSILPGLALMQPNTALSLALSGLALLGMGREDVGPRTRRIASGLAGLASLIGMLTLVEYAIGVDLGIDLFLFGKVPGSEGPPSPGRMSFMTATCIASLGAALPLLDAKARLTRHASQAFALLTTLFALLDLIGYAYGVRFLYMVGAYSTMALHTAATLFVLGIGTLAARPGYGLMGRFMAEDAGGWLLRNLLPVAVLLPLALGGIRVLGEEAGLFNPRFGSAVLVLSNIVALIVLLWMTAGRLSELDRGRTRAEEGMREREEWLRTTLGSIGDAVVATDAEGLVKFMNPVAESLMGWTQADASGRRLPEVFVIADETTRQPVENPALRALRDGRIVGLANHTILIARDGTERAIDDSAAPIRSGDGSVAGAVLVFRDVTARRGFDLNLARNEHRLRMALDAARMVAWEWTPADGSLLVSENAADVFGLPAGTTITGIEQGVGLLHPDDIAAYRETYRKAIDERGGYLTQYRLLRPDDGSVLWMEERGQPICDESGEVVRLVGVVMDISVRRRSEERLLESEARFRTLFDSMDEGFCVVEMIFDPAGRPVDYRFLEMNPAFEQHSGLRGVVGRTIREVAPGHEASWFETYGRVAATGEPIRFVSEAKALGDRWLDVYAFRLGGPGSPKVAVLFNDITARIRVQAERDRLEDDLRGVAADLSEASLRKDEFLATLAHELRNPLAPIRNGLQIMKVAGDDRKAVDESRSLMERQVTHMVRLIDDLMDVSRITKNKMELRRERVDLAAVVRNAVETSRPLIDAAGHELTVTLPARPILLDADATRLSQVFSNLLNNAAKYTERGGDIALVAERQGSDVVVTVRDNGVGIPPELLPKLFVMFTQIDRSLERSQGGLGIGLSLVKTLVEMHGGVVEGRSGGHGLGSEFVVRLPIVLAASARPAAHDRNDRGNGPTTALRILVVDDNVDSARTLARLLKLLGHETRTAHDGGEAVEAAEEYRPELMLLDIGLPVMSGYEVARAIRRRDWGREVAIVALTGWGQEDDRRRSKEAGIDDHLVKPLDPTLLESLLAGMRPGPDGSSIPATS